MNALARLEGQQVTIRSYEGEYAGELVEVGEDGVILKQTRLNDVACRWESRLVFIETLSVHVIEGGWTL